jgi:hypothetical protein
MSPETHIPPKEIVPDFVRLALGKTRLLLPGKELMAIEPMQNINQKSKGDLNYVTMKGVKVPVYAFGEDLQLVSVKDSRHQFCVFLDDSQDRIGIFCDDAGKVTLDDLILNELPDCMHSTVTVIQNIAVSKNNLYCVSNLTNLLQLVRPPGCG